VCCHLEAEVHCATAGKSTFLNALCGANCLPSTNVPETARICRLIHTPLQPGQEPVLIDTSQGSNNPSTVVGEAAIHAHLKYLNREVLCGASVCWLSLQALARLGLSEVLVWMCNAAFVLAGPPAGSAAQR
jgi:Dynamin family